MLRLDENARAPAASEARRHANLLRAALSLRGVDESAKKITLSDMTWEIHTLLCASAQERRSAYRQKGMVCWQHLFSLSSTQGKQQPQHMPRRMHRDDLR